ncbi:MAG: YIP1 family protein [Rhabdochlamydiaceae bacterium]|jgi:hypothetical protein
MKEKLPFNPWLKIWVSPRETIRAITASNPKHFFYFLSGVYGFMMLLQIAQDFSLGLQMSLPWIIGGALVLSVGLGVLVFNIFGGLIYWTGKWIGGKSSFTNIKAAIAWAYVPSVVNAVVWFLLIGVFGTQLFMSTFADTVFVGYQLSIVFFGFLAQIIASVWGFFMGLQTLGEVQGFSAWKALLNVIIPFFMLTMTFWFVSWICYRLMTVPGLS